MRIAGIILLLLLIFAGAGQSQTNSLKQVNGLPTKEIYDLHLDTKGYLWIAHDLGISRYDGVNFVSYSIPNQTSLSATDLLEDKLGRIWFHNFTGQIFYIENDEMKLLAGYNAKKESYFPRIALYDDMLVASTQRGLFTCAIDDLKCSYIPCANAPDKGTTSLAILNKSMVAYGDGSWFTYHKGGPLKLVTLKGDAGYIKASSSTLIVKTVQDTMYLISNPDGIVSVVAPDGDNLKLVKKSNAGSFLNTLTITPGNIWVHTILKSYSYKKPALQLGGHNLTDIVVDKEGNTWYSSLKNGLLLSPLFFPGALSPINATNKDNPVSWLEKKDKNLILGTQNGNIITYDPQAEKVIKSLQLPGSPGNITYLYNLGEDQYIVGTQINTYHADLNTKRVVLYPIKTLKQAFKSSEFLFLASARELMIKPLAKNINLKDLIKNRFKGFEVQSDAFGEYLHYQMRCRAVCYDEKSKILYAAFKDGLHVIDKNGITPFLYKGATVYATALNYIDSKLFIATINKGVIIVQGDKTINLTADDGLTSNTVLKLKRTGNWLWLFGGGATKVVDLTTLKLVSDINLTGLTDKLLLGVEVIGKKAFVATPDGFYSFEVTSPVKKFTIKNYLQAVELNSKTLPANHSHVFDYFENNIQFNLSVPFYNEANNIYIKYLLKGTSNNNWQVTKAGDRSITFSELSPGKYYLKAYAVHPRYGYASAPISYGFTIAEQWWKTWWFRLIIVLFIVLLAGYIAGSYFFNRLQLQKALYEQQLTIQTERQRISSEIHDDVGAGLSAIKLYVQMAQGGEDKKVDLTQIGGMINDMSDKINEIIWSTNTDNDTFESLVYYIEYHSYKLFEHSNITFRAIVPIDIPDYVITSEKRRNIYLVVKEILHNALKHARADVITLKIKFENDELHIKVTDNGVGINFHKKPKGMGMKNIRTRTAQANGTVTIHSGANGTSISLIFDLK